jgi:hypothetical protein
MAVRLGTGSVGVTLGLGAGVLVPVTAVREGGVPEAVGAGVAVEVGTGLDDGVATATAV